MEKKILSVTVPAYNVEQYLSRCLESFRIPQVMEQVEVLVINDGGTDGSAAIAREYEKRYPGTYRVIDKENGGHGSVINRGIEEAAGKYFRVVDGDDWVEREGFIRLVRHLEETDADMVLSNYHWVDHRTGRKKAEVREICPGISYGKTCVFAEVSDRIFMKMHAITYKTRVIRDQPERLDERCFYVDAEYMCFPLPFVKTVSAVEDFVYQYRIGLPGQSMSAVKLRKQCGQHERVLRRLLDFYGRHKREECARILESALARFVTSQYKIYLMFPENHKADLLSLEKELKAEYPAVYSRISQPGIVLLRKTGYVLYPLVSFLVRAWAG